MSIIAVDTSVVTYALKLGLNSDNPDEVNYICNRLIETVPQMQRTLTLWCIQDIKDCFEKEPDRSYLLSAPLKRLLSNLESHVKEFRK